MYGCSQAYVALKKAFFSQKEETLQEFSLVIMSLIVKVKQHAPDRIPNEEIWLHNQFAIYVLNGTLQSELKHLGWFQPNMTLLDVCTEAIIWEWECILGGARDCSFLVTFTYRIYFGVQGRPCPTASKQSSELGELKIPKLQLQLNQVSNRVTFLQGSPQYLISWNHFVICQQYQWHKHFTRECDQE